MRIDLHWRAFEPMSCGRERADCDAMGVGKPGRPCWLRTQVESCLQVRALQRPNRAVLSARSPAHCLAVSRYVRVEPDQCSSLASLLSGLAKRPTAAPQQLGPTCLKPR